MVSLVGNPKFSPHKLSSRLNFLKTLFNRVAICTTAWCWGAELLQFDVLDADQFIDNCVDSEAGRGVDLQLGGDIAAVGGDRVHREAQVVGYLLAGHTLGYAADNLLFALGELFGGVPIVGNLLLVVARALALERLLEPHNRGHKEVVLHKAVAGDVVLAVDDVEEHRVELVGVALLGVVAYDDALELRELVREARIAAGVLLGKGLNGIVTVEITLHE